MIIGVLVSVSAVVHARSTPENTCVNNLRQIDGAIQQWALENDKPGTNSYSLADTNLTQYLAGKLLPVCPSGGIYREGKTADNEPTCSIHGSMSNLVSEREGPSVLSKGLVASLAVLAITTAGVSFIARKRRLKNELKV